MIALSIALRALGNVLTYGPILAFCALSFVLLLGGSVIATSTLGPIVVGLALAMVPSAMVGLPILTAGDSLIDWIES